MEQVLFVFQLHFVAILDLNLALVVCLLTRFLHLELLLI